MKVLKHSSQQVRSPLLVLMVDWLLLDRFGAPEWAFGVYWTLATIFIACWVYMLCVQEPIGLDDLK